MPISFGQIDLEQVFLATELTGTGLQPLSWHICKYTRVPFGPNPSTYVASLQIDLHLI